MNVMFFSSINTAEFQQILAAFMIPVFNLPWVKRCEYILSLVNLREAAGIWKGQYAYSTERHVEAKFRTRLCALSATTTDPRCSNVSS